LKFQYGFQEGRNPTTTISKRIFGMKDGAHQEKLFAYIRHRVNRKRLLHIRKDDRSYYGGDS
jgi:hypothetical protein